MCSRRAESGLGARPVLDPQNTSLPYSLSGVDEGQVKHKLVAVVGFSVGI